MVVLQDDADNGGVVLLEAAFVVGVLSLIVYGTIWLLMRPKSQSRRALPRGQWRVGHYDIDGETRVVLQKVQPGGSEVLDEHVIATIPITDPDYDARYLEATSTARERRALFELEDE
jgi:hypothetical protein